MVAVDVASSASHGTSSNLFGTTSLSGGASGSFTISASATIGLLFLSFGTGQSNADGIFTSWTLSLSSGSAVFTSVASSRKQSGVDTDHAGFVEIYKVTNLPSGSVTLTVQANFSGAGAYAGSVMGVLETYSGPVDAVPLGTPQLANGELVSSLTISDTLASGDLFAAACVNGTAAPSVTTGTSDQSVTGSTMSGVDNMTVAHNSGTGSVSLVFGTNTADWSAVTGVRLIAATGGPLNTGAVIQTKSARTTSADTSALSVTFDNVVANGNTIVVIASGFNAALGLNNCTDNMGNTYTRFAVAGAASFPTVAIYYDYNVIGGTVTVTITNASVQGKCVSVLEVQGWWEPLYSATGQGTTSPMSTTATSAFPQSELLSVAGVGVDTTNTSTFGDPSLYTLLTETGSTTNRVQSFVYRGGAGTAAENASWTYGAALTSYRAAVVVFHQVDMRQEVHIDLWAPSNQPLVPMWDNAMWDSPVIATGDQNTFGILALGTTAFAPLSSADHNITSLTPLGVSAFAPVTGDRTPVTAILPAAVAPISPVSHDAPGLSGIVPIGVSPVAPVTPSMTVASQVPIGVTGVAPITPQMTIVSQVPIGVIAVAPVSHNVTEAAAVPIGAAPVALATHDMTVVTVVPVGVVPSSISPSSTVNIIGILHIATVPVGTSTHDTSLAGIVPIGTVPVALISHNMTVASQVPMGVVPNSISPSANQTTIGLLNLTAVAFAPATHDTSALLAGMPIGLLPVASISRSTTMSAIVPVGVLDVATISHDQPVASQVPIASYARALVSRDLSLASAVPVGLTPQSLVTSSRTVTALCTIGTTPIGIIQMQYTIVGRTWIGLVSYSSLQATKFPGNPLETIQIQRWITGGAVQYASDGQLSVRNTEGFNQRGSHD